MSVLFNAEGCTPGNVARTFENNTYAMGDFLGELRVANGIAEKSDQEQFDFYIDVLSNTLHYERSALSVPDYVIAKEVDDLEPVGMEM